MEVNEINDTFAPINPHAMKFLCRFSLVFLLFSLLSCSSSTIQYPAVLLQADSLAMVNPEAALTLLDSISPSMTAAQEPVRRYYTLLTIKASDKAFLPHKSDSLVLDLLDYYEKRGDANLLPEVYYYAGRVTSDLGDALQALDYFQKALQSIDTETRENTTIAILSYAQMGYLLRNQHLYEEAKQCLINSYSIDSILHDTTRMSVCMRDIAYVDMLQGKFEESMTEYLRAEELALAVNDSSRLFNTSIQKAKLFIFLGRYDEAQECLDKYPKLLNKANRNTYYGVQADLCSKRGSEKEAYAYYKLLLSSGNLIDRSNANLWLASHAIREKDATQAISYLSSVNRIEDSLRIQHNYEAVAIAQSLYNYSQKEKKILALRNKEDRYFYSLSIVSALVIILLLILFIVIKHYYSVKRKNEEQQLRLAHLYELKRIETDKEIQETHLRMEELKAQLQEKTSEYSSISAEYENLSLLKEKLEVERRISQSFYERWKKTDSFALINTKSNAGVPLTADDWKMIERQIQQLDPSFFQKLHCLLDFTPIEWQVSILIKLQVLPSRISVLVCRKDSTISTIRSRLYSKVTGKTGSASEWDSMIMNL